MELLVWSHTYSVGDKQIDTQHQKLMGILNELHNVNQSGGEKSKIDKILDELVQYTVYHFSTEEKMFAETSYHDAEHHASAHKKLIAEVGSFLDLLKNNDQFAKEKLMVFLTDWLKDHILGEDKRFANFLKTKKSTEEDADL